MSHLTPIADRDFGPYEAGQLLWRAGFGGTWEEAEALAAMGLDKAVNSLVGIPPAAAEASPPFATNPEETDQAFQRRVRDLAGDARRAAFDLRQRRERDGIDELKFWWLERMRTTKRPLEEKMTLFWHSHFASSFEDKIERVHPLWAQNQLFRENALAPFPVLLREIIRNPAMLVWLDNASSRKDHPNENLGRELMELFSMGVNQYTEEDVREAARALTGSSVDRDTWTFRFDAEAHDDGVKKFLGWTGNFNGDDVVRIICEKEETARFITRKLLRFFVRDNPPDDLVEEATGRFQAYSLGVRPFLATLFKSQAFHAAESRNAIVKSPVVLAIGSLKGMRARLPAQKVLLDALRLMGQDLFFPPDVNGWPGGMNWINSNTLLIRYNFANFLVHGVSPGEFKIFDPAKFKSATERRAFVESQRATAGIDWSPKRQILASHLEHKLSSAPHIVDYYIREFLQRPVPRDTRDEYLKFCETDAAGGRTTLTPSDENFDERVKGLVHLIMSTPDYQLC